MLKTAVYSRDTLQRRLSTMPAVLAANFGQVPPSSKTKWIKKSLAVQAEAYPAQIPSYVPVVSNCPIL
jgi:hypothetical protein